MTGTATPDRQVTVESSDNTCSTGEGNGKPLQYSCLENPTNTMKRQKAITQKNRYDIHACTQKDMTQKSLPRSVGAQHTAGEEQGYSPRSNAEAKPREKQRLLQVCLVVKVVRCCKEQHCTRTWNVRSMNHDKLEVTKQETARVNTNILGISEIRWT